MSEGSDVVEDFIRKRNEGAAAEANRLQQEQQQSAPGYGEFENPFRPKPQAPKEET